MIKHNAASDELNSPYFHRNEKTCQQWEKFALDNAGEIEGTFNSWSYKVFIKIDNPTPWRIIVSRSTHSNGVLLFSSKYQNLHDQIVIKTKVNSEAEFIIKKPSLKDFFSGKTMSRLGVNNSYTVLGKTKGIVFDKLSLALSEQFKRKQVFRVELKNKLLTITINNANEEFELIKSLVLSNQH